MITPVCPSSACNEDVYAGYLYWQRGLESAMVAHMLAHVVMVTAEMIS